MTESTAKIPKQNTHHIEELKETILNKAVHKPNAN